MKHTVKDALAGYFAKAQAVTTSQVVGNEGSLYVGNANGGIGIIAVAKTDVVITDEKILTINVQDSADDSSFAVFANLATITAAGDTTYSAGDQIGEMFIVPPDANDYIAVYLGANAATSGTIDIYEVYLPR